MSSGREILTLQFGHYANFVGTHWWNLQELGFCYNSERKTEINHDVLYREGITDKGKVTFTPRLLIADLKGSLKSLSKTGTLYDDDIPLDKINPLWNEGTDVQRESPIAKNAFQECLDAGDSSGNSPTLDQEASRSLDKEVEVWSDFLYTRYHPRTINIINDYEHNCASKDFDSFPLGSSVWNSPDWEEAFSDKIRIYLEECDNFQGFHVLLDSTNAFSGMATSCIEYLHDQYDTKTVFAIPIIPGYYEDYKCASVEEENASVIKDSLRVLNLAFTYVTLAHESSIFSPLSVGRTGWRQPGPAIEFNHLIYDISSSYQSSAILAAALDTFTLKYRIKSSNYSLCDLAVDLTSFNRKAVAASLCLPFSFNQGADFIDCLDNWDGPLSHSITPNCRIGTSRTMQVVSLRGIPEDRLKRPAGQAGKQKDLPAYKCNSISEMLDMYYAFSCDACSTNVTTIEQGLSVKPPFPTIFSPKIGCNGEIGYNQRLETTGIGVERVPVLAGLHTGREMGECLESLHSEARKINIGRFHQFCEYGRDDFKENLDKLLTLRENYENKYFI